MDNTTLTKLSQGVSATEYQDVYTEIECYKTGNVRRAIVVMIPDCIVKGQ